MKGSLHKLTIYFYFITGIFSFFFLSIYGFDYYKLPIEERVFSAKHQILKPSGLLGHGLGIIGSLMMIIGVLSYMIRKRWRKINKLGYLKHWLEFHIFMCSVGPILVLFHTAFKFGGIISIGFWSMVIVVLSGIVGRVIYVQLPKTLQGENLSKSDIENNISDLIHKLSPDLKEKVLNVLVELDEKSNKNYVAEFTTQKLTDSLKLIFKENSIRKKKIKELKFYINQQRIPIEDKKYLLKISEQILALRTKEHLLNAFDNLLRHWHIFHLPFALSMFILMFIHIIVAILFGAKWIF
ncbi:MAG: hypothetical protein WHV63_05230 [Ignavibacteria bacterium]|nr:hypothetical protein [Ignavibacteria bacterium]